MTPALIILSEREQEYLLHAVEAALPVDDARQFFLWTQGPLQALLPHQVLVALHFEGQDRLLHMECQHSMVLDAGLRHRLAGDEGLAVRLARHCRQHGCRSLLLDAVHGADDAHAAHGAPAADAAQGTQGTQGAQGAQGAKAALAVDTADGSASQSAAPFRAELRALGFNNLALQATSRLPGGSSVFVLLGLPQRPHARHAYFLALLLPHLHLMVQHLAQWRAACAIASVTVLTRPVSAREMEILHWVREGKTNDEIGQILGISGLTVKNHLQRLYRLLGVSNRTHAIARGAALRLFEQPPPHWSRQLAFAA